jgi:putative membrane protein
LSTAPSVGQLLGTWSPDAGPLLAVLLAAAAYAAGVRRATRWPARRTAAFASGLLVLALALLSGIDVWADRLLSVHMTQHVLLTMIAPPLLLLGAPEQLALRTLPRGGRDALARALHGRVAHALARPLTAWLLLPLVMVGVHLPGPFGFALAHGGAHALEHLLLLSAGIVFWVPVAGGALAPHRLSPLGRMGYLLAAMGPLGVVGAVLTAAGGPIYPTYDRAAAALGISAVDDQQLAGAVMWVGGGYALVVATLAAVWAALTLEERRTRRREAYEDARALAGGGS